MNAFIKSAAVWSSLAWLLVGCGQNPATIAANSAKAFQTADPQTKASWDAALAAMKTNGYAPALLELRRLAARTNLTPEQTKAVSETGTALTDRMYAAAKKGDAAATEAIKQLDALRAR